MTASDRERHVARDVLLVAGGALVGLGAHLAIGEPLDGAPGSALQAGVVSGIVRSFLALVAGLHVVFTGAARASLAAARLDHAATARPSAGFTLLLVQWCALLHYALLILFANLSTVMFTALLPLFVPMLAGDIAEARREQLGRQAPDRVGSIDDGGRDRVARQGDAEALVEGQVGVVHEQAHGGGR